MLRRRLLARFAAPTALLAACFLLLLAASTVASAASGAQRAAVAVEGGDFFFRAPDVIEGGLVSLRFTNTGRESHHAQLVRLPDEVSFEQFAAALQGDERAALGLVREVGGAASVEAGRSAEVAVDLEPGLYALICVIPSPIDRVRHVAKGMVRPLIVTEASAMVEPPAVLGTIAMRDFTFDLPEVIPAGRATYRVVNEGPGQPHEVAIARLAPGKTAEDARRAIMSPGGPPPFQPVGGFQSTEVGGDGYVTFELEPGAYVALCRVAEPASGVSHVHLGMVREFRVE